MTIRIFILICFLIVITDPYKGLKYNEVNVYDVNYCSGKYCPDQVIIYDYMEEEEIEEIEEEDKPLIINHDFHYRRN